ncbi:hypothetical protein [Bdellovibrio bacteriovorus]|uniref:Uncharacterized protein n=1 Tax=Bdellovibrio bacteriovorus TaxID=959 RepID=A0A1Z3NAX9_BDEBC|nr:hypothetical protein [Bdellovibrio bacteriovorus]ASD64581.1 hypothetical protein B9G79_13870 [Bdellovibrio bacteriovorus]
MENFLNSLPKPVLAILVLVVAIIAFMIMSPPHSVCDTQAEAFKELQKGNIFPTDYKKSKIPPTIVRAKEACQLGNSAGSCYEYFTILREVAEGVGKSSAECTSQLYGINEVRSNLNDGIELMARLAWGTKPPEMGLERFGWMQDAEIAIFCRLKNIYTRANGEEAWTNFRKKVYEKFPGEELPPSADPALVAVEPRKATQVLSEQDIWNRSLFSVRCEVY